MRKQTNPPLRNDDSPRHAISTQLAVIGSGYVGLTAAACLVHLGHSVRCTDVLPERVAALAAGYTPIYELGLEELHRAGVRSGHLTFGCDNTSAVAGADVVFLCLPTPQGIDGRADLSYVRNAVLEIGPYLRPNAIVVNKSTVPVGATRIVAELIGRDDVHVVANPEFLREGSAVFDFLNPDRIVVGADEAEVGNRVAALYSGIASEVVMIDPESAELVKYASNSFLATKISFVNSIAALCEEVGADVRHVARGMGLDKRIGKQFLEPGPGWGGSCFPKDSAALLRISEDAGYDFTLLSAAILANEQQHYRIVDQIVALAGGSVDGQVVALWGLTFKANTDDTRHSPAIDLARHLTGLGARVQAYDPTVALYPGIEVHGNALDACDGAALLVVTTEWEEFRLVELAQVAGRLAAPRVLDTRNVLEEAAARQAGLLYRGVGFRTDGGAGVTIPAVRASLEVVSAA